MNAILKRFLIDEELRIALDQVARAKNAEKEDEEKFEERVSKAG